MPAFPLIEWPYPVDYGKEIEVSADVLVLGGGIAGCWAAIAAARKGAKVVILEKGATIRSGAGGGGCDHWGYAITNNPNCPLSAEEVTAAELEETGGYCNAMSIYMTCRESYDTLLEMEKMGGKIRDTADEFAGAEFRDEKTKMLFAYDYATRHTIRIWGTTFKPALYRECKRLGVKVIDRVMVTGLLTEKGKQGERVIGATGLNVRTGQLVVVQSRATILSVSRPDRLWDFATEHNALSHLRCPASGGYAMAWRAGAAFTMMEKSVQAAFMYPSPVQGAGHPGNTWYACSVVDANGVEIPWIDRDGKPLRSVSERYYPAPGQRFINPRAHIYAYGPPSPVSMDELIRKGELTLPVYADLPGMPDDERRAIFGLMVGQESKSWITNKYYREAGFDPSADYLQGYQWVVPYAFGLSPIGKARRGYDYSPGSRSVRRLGPGWMGGLVVDWDLKTSLEGLYAAGDSIFSGNEHPHAAVTGRYAGRRAAEYARDAPSSTISRRQLADEKARIYGPVRRRDGVDWKELNVGINKAMTVYCGEPKNEVLLRLGLEFLADLRAEAANNLFATDPHKLGRCLEVVDILDSAELVIQSCLARPASSRFLNFNRADYPELDPRDWSKFVTIRLADGRVKIGELPIGFWGSLEENYQAHCGL